MNGMWQRKAQIGIDGSGHEHHQLVAGIQQSFACCLCRTCFFVMVADNVLCIIVTYPGSAFGSIWGKCGGVGPVSVHPDYWNSGESAW